MTEWTPSLVEERLAEAAFVLKRLPEPRRQGYFSTWPEVIHSFADKVAARPFRSFRGTSISGALAFGAELFDRTAFQGERSVIDISGDGPNNIGPPVTTTRDAALAKGIVVNGLPILISPSPTFSHLDQYYA